MSSSYMSSESRVEFLSPEDLGEREWGTETLLALVSRKYSMKRLEIKAGSKGGLQFHHKKDECGYLISGTLIVRYDDGTENLVKRELQPGAVFHFPPGVVHQEEAVTDCVVIEVSTPHFNDRVRVEKSYGLPSSGGLPSVSIEEVQER